jgi:hypothetical protein
MSGIGPWALCGRLRPVTPVGPRRFACARNVAYVVSYDYGFVRPSRERRPRLNPSRRRSSRPPPPTEPNVVEAAWYLVPNLMFGVEPSV